MVTVEVSDESVLLKFQGRRGPTTNKLSVEETEDLLIELEMALETLQESQTEDS
jgi:hypothetical protein